MPADAHATAPKMTMVPVMSSDRFIILTIY
jgi:hypothetical protein